jgi:hypothetical protein
MSDAPKPVSVNTGRKPYVRPVLTQVRLRPNEAVLGSCRTASTGGPAGHSRCNLPIACSVLHS